MDKLRCVVKTIKFNNPDNGYTILRCSAAGYQNYVSVVGIMPTVRIDEEIEVTGEWKVVPKYGEQFEVQTFEEVFPATLHGIENYLSGGFIKGIGPTYAKRIVETFGLDTLKIMEEDPDRLAEVPGIGKTKVEAIKNNWAEQRDIKNIMVFLQNYDISPGMSVKIYKQYGHDSVAKLRDNPYCLADDIWGVGFLSADKIAEKMGIEKEKYIRCRSGLLYTLKQLSDDGHCYATREMLLDKGEQILDVKQELLQEAIGRMIAGHDVIAESGDDGEALYLPVYYYSEVGASQKLVNIMVEPSLRPLNPAEFPADGQQGKVTAKEKKFVYDEVQLQAIRTAIRSKIMVLTGGPGTGKTTTVQGIIKAFETFNAKILLAAPTGRAAKRLAEATGKEAKTIHRLLEVSPNGGYQRNGENTLKGDVLIVDECSMIDIVLMYNLLKAVPLSMTLIFVGDIDQLPSVGAGNVLRDIIDSECFPVVRLTRVFRQAQSSRIIMNAHRVNRGVMPDISNGQHSDFFFMEREEPEVIAQTITELVTARLPRHYRLPATQIQVLTPMQKSLIGAANLNKVLQEALNPKGAGIKRGNFTFRPRDKVMQIRNNYDKQVFNGDIGVVEALYLPQNAADGEPYLVVNFENRSLKYEVFELDELVLAYATTIHKAQGSEYPIVVMPISMSHFIMLQRNLIYTGITRAKRALVLVGTKKALNYAVHHLTVSLRNTRLKERLRVDKEAAKKSAADNRRQNSLQLSVVNKQEF